MSVTGYSSKRFVTITATREVWAPMSDEMVQEQVVDAMEFKDIVVHVTSEEPKQILEPVEAVYNKCACSKCPNHVSKDQYTYPWCSQCFGICK